MYLPYSKIPPASYFKIFLLREKCMNVTFNLHTEMLIKNK